MLLQASLMMYLQPKGTCHITGGLFVLLVFKVKSCASILVNQHTGISLIQFDNTNTEDCLGLELISLILSQQAEFVGLAEAFRTGFK